jgi:hypothetical protein
MADATGNFKSGAGERHTCEMCLIECNIKTRENGIEKLYPDNRESGAETDRQGDIKRYEFSLGS